MQPPTTATGNSWPSGDVSWPQRLGDSGAMTAPPPRRRPGEAPVGRPACTRAPVRVPASCPIPWPSTARDGHQRHLTNPAPGPAFPLVKGRLGWWWPVLGSNQRRPCRRSYSSAQHPTLTTYRDEHRARESLSRQLRCSAVDVSERSPSSEDRARPRRDVREAHTSSPDGNAQSGRCPEAAAAVIRTRGPPDPDSVPATCPIGRPTRDGSESSRSRSRSTPHVRAAQVSGGAAGMTFQAGHAGSIPVTRSTSARDVRAVGRMVRPSRHPRRLSRSRRSWPCPPEISLAQDAPKVTSVT